MPGPDPAKDEAENAAAEAGRIGGSPSAEPSADSADEAQRPLVEAGQGEAEGFEQAERELIEHSSHGDQHAARRAAQEAAPDADDTRGAETAEADHEHTSERPVDDR